MLSASSFGHCSVVSTGMPPAAAVTWAYTTGQTSERRVGAGTWKWSESFVMAISGLERGMSVSSFPK